MFVWLQPGGESGVSNAGVIVDDDGLTSIDTLMVRSQWEPFAEAVDGARPAVRRIVLTHAPHRPRRRHEGVPARGACSRRRRRATLLDQRMPIDAYKAFMPAFDDEFDDLAELGTRPVDAPRRRARRRSRRGSRCCPASGHTDGDLIVLVADADVCFAGRPLLLRRHAARVPGRPAMWADMLDAVADLADTIVPGHGPVGGERRGARAAGVPAARASTRTATRRDPARPVGLVARARAATPSTSSAPRSSPRAATRCRPAMLKAIGFG